jgi:hypothetical protein
LEIENWSWRIEELGKLENWRIGDGKLEMENWRMDNIGELKNWRMNGDWRLEIGEWRILICLFFGFACGGEEYVCFVFHVIIFIHLEWVVIASESFLSKHSRCSNVLISVIKMKQ